MKTNKRTINYILLTATLFTMLGCGGGSGGGSSSCLSGVKDSDGDGFHDAIDIAPNDASIPGDFSTPEKILANEKVKYMLKKGKENDVKVHTYLEHNPPNLTGYYKSEEGGYAGSIINDNFVLPFVYLASEKRVCSTKERYDEYFSFAGKNTSLYSRKYAMLRGNKKEYTIYSPYLGICQNNRKKHYNGVNIYSAKLNSEGDLIKSSEITVALYTGSNCKGSFVVSHYSDAKKVTDLDELEYMCVDGDKAYIPKETWKNKAKESCKCTANIEIECE